MAADGIDVKGIVLSRRSVHDELKESYETLICLDDDPGLAAHAVSVAARGSFSDRTLRVRPGSIRSAGPGACGTRRSRVARSRGDAFPECPHLRWQERRAVGAFQR